MTFSFGLEQADQATRNELVKRAMGYLLPTTADTTPPTIVGFKYPSNLSTATTADPVETEVTAYDERGDMDYVNLYANGSLVQRVDVYPFQFRYTPPASAVGTAVKLTAEAVDKAGNKSTRDLYVNVLATDQRVEAPVPVNAPSLIGTPRVGEQMGCISGGFLNSPKTLTYAWLRNGTAITGATAASYTLTDADLGRTIACRVTASNDAGTADSTSESLVVSPAIAPAFSPTPAPAAVAPLAAAAPAPKKAASLAFKATCKLAKSRKSVACTVSSNSTAKFSGSVRLQGSKLAKASKSGKRKVKLTLRSTKALKKGQKVVLTLKSGKTTKRITAKVS